MDEAFGRQPKPVKVTIIGESAIDVAYWNRVLRLRAESAGDITQTMDEHNIAENYASFKIYPRAVND